MKKSFLFHISKPSTSHLEVQANVEMALTAATFEYDVTVLFTDAGVLNLVPDQANSKLSLRATDKLIKSFPVYDIEKIYVCEDALEKWGLDQTMLIVPSTLVDSEEIVRLHRSMHHIG